MIKGGHAASLPKALRRKLARKLAGMQTRHLFLVGYDIAHPRRLRKVLRCVQGHALGGQKSFYECWLTVGELQTIMAALKQIIEPDTDRVLFVRLDARSQSRTLGCAQAITQTDYFHIS